MTLLMFNIALSEGTVHMATNIMQRLECQANGLVGFIGAEIGRGKAAVRIGSSKWGGGVVTELVANVLAFGSERLQWNQDCRCH